MKTAPQTLTPREREILGLLTLGMTNREIAEKLYLSIRTVETHRANLQGKLQLHRRSELVAFVHGHGPRQAPRPGDGEPRTGARPARPRARG